MNSEMKIPWKVKRVKSLYLRNAYSLNLEREYNAGTSLRHPYGMKMYAELTRIMKRKKLGIKSLNDNNSLEARNSYEWIPWKHLRNSDQYGSGRIVI